MIKLLLFICFLENLLHAELVSITNQCTCEQIISQKECEKALICVWTSIHQKSTSTESADVFQCVSKSTADSQQSSAGPDITEQTTAQSYCSTVSDSECVAIQGCALFQSKCIPFSGCSAYSIALTSSWCQKINTQCVIGIQDTIKQCTQKKTCKEYTQQIQCETSPSTSGNFKCKWDSDRCRDIACSDATNKTECSEYGTNCLFNGANCLAGSLPSCTSYSTGQCESLIGSEGTCNTGTSSYCETRQCSQASSNSNTDAQCNEYKSGCVTTGKGCTQTRKTCSQYEGTVHTCLGYIGSDGNCEGVDETPQKCQTKKCSNAPTTYSTDTQCSSYQINCKSTGKGCVDQLKSCTTYQSDCSAYIGSEGKCAADKSGACRGRQCSDLIGKNDADCDAYLTGCKTNGQACVTSQELSYCASYDNTMTSCDNYIGRDGKCIQDGDDQSKCRVIVCTDGPKSLTTTEQCNSFLTGCVTDNGSGCKDKTSESDVGTNCGPSSDQIMSHSDCQVYGTNCTSDGQKCIIKAGCVEYKSLTVCETASTTDIGDTCIWHTDSQTCSAKQCSDKQFKTTEECNQYLSGCVTNGESCVTEDNATCLTYTTAQSCIKNTNKLPCIYYDKKCFKFTQCGDITSTSHSYCNAISQHCTTNGIQCIPITACELYTIQASCVVGINETSCGWAGSSCITFNDCTEYQTGVYENCQAYNSNCVTNGTTCIKKMKCSEYTQQESCHSGGSDGQCFFEDGKCRPKECKDVSKADSISDTTTHEQCQQVTLSANSKCTSDGNKCVPIQKCIDYKNNSVGCVVGLDGDCIFNTKQKYCRPTICEDYYENCEQVFSDGSCISNGTYCIRKQNCKDYKNKDDCKKGFDGQCRYMTITNDAGEDESSCELITKCEEASDDEEACKALSHVCYWSQIQVGTDGESNSCLPLDCETMQKQNNGECKPVPDFLEEKYKICYKIFDVCVEGEGNILASEVDCFEYSAQTYRWIDNSCQACFQPTKIRIIYQLINDLLYQKNLVIALALLTLLWS